MRSRFDFFKDFRIILLLIAIVLSVISISPNYENGNFTTDVQMGLDFVGGSSIQLRLEGSIVELQGSKEDILAYELGEQYELSSSGEESIEFTVKDGNATAKNLEELGYGTPTIKDNTVTLNITDEGAIASYLENITEHEILLLEKGETSKYEIRGPILSEEEKKGMTEEEIKNKSQEILEEQLNEAGIELISYENRVSSHTTEQTKNIINTKLNYAGLKDIRVRTWGEDYILVDLAGMPLEEARQYVAQPGKFEIKIFVNETKTERICTGASIKRVSPYRREGMQGSWGVPFELTNSAAQTFIEMTIQYGATDNPQAHPIAMYLDEKEVFKAPLNTSLASSIKSGVWTDNTLIASTGTGEEARQRAQQLETHLRAGSLPVKPEIVSEGYVDPVLGKNFLKGVFSAIILAILAVAFIVYLRYKESMIVIPLLIAGFSETLIVLGIATQIQQLDLPSIGGLIATLGTGVDQLVIITDEVLRGKTRSRQSLVKRVSAAFSIIFASAATTVIAMTPLAYMQLGVLRGFAIVTIIGILVGIFITRPAYGNMIKKIVGR